MISVTRVPDRLSTFSVFGNTVIPLTTLPSKICRCIDKCVRAVKEFWRLGSKVAVELVISDRSEGQILER